MGAPNSTARWSGVVLQRPQGGISTISGTSSVPNLFPATPGVWNYTSSWVGIDGWLDVGGPDVLQVGVNQQVIDRGGDLSRQIYVFYGWGTGGVTPVTNFPVAPGDTMAWSICVNQQASPLSATFYVMNVSSGFSTSWNMPAPPMTDYRGASAEWIVEAPSEQDGAITPLADYRTIFFDDAVTNAGRAGSGDSITMVNPTSGQLLSDGMAVADTVVRCRRVTS